MISSRAVAFIKSAPTDKIKIVLGADCDDYWAACDQNLIYIDKTSKSLFK